MAQFQDYLEQFCMGLIGDTRLQWDAPHVNESMPSMRHTLDMNMHSKCRVCVEKMHGSFHGCEQCGVALHLKCISNHGARANNLL